MRIFSFLLMLISAFSLCAGCDAEPEQSNQKNTRASVSLALDQVIEDYVKHFSSDSDGDHIPDDVSAAAFVATIDFQKELLQRVRDVPDENLELAEVIDRRLLIGILESSIYTAESRRIWENQPSLYLPVSDITSAMDLDSDLSNQVRADKIKSVLAALPERLGHAYSNLKNPPRRFTEAAIYQTEQVIAALRSGQNLGQGPEFGSFNEAIQETLALLEGYLSFLQADLLPRSNGSWELGRDAYDYTLAHRWFMDADADEILERGFTAFAKTEALAQQVAERIDSGKPWAEVYETLKDRHPDAANLKQAYQQQIDAARVFVIEHNLVTLPEGERVITVDTPLAMRRSSPFGTFDGVDPFGDQLEGRLVLTPIEEGLSGEQHEQRLRSHHQDWIPIIAVHEAYPGHHVHGLKIQANPRRLRKAVQESIFTEGWGLFTEELMFEYGFLQGDAVRLTQLRNRLWRAARVILDVQLHTGQITFEDAVNFLVEKVRFERYAAELEVGMYIRRPTYVLGYLIGMQEIEAIRKDYYAKYGQPDPPSEFFDRLLGVGSIPPALVRLELQLDTP